MNTKLCRFLSLAILLWTAGAARAATTYHVATTGQDTNPGTLALPWRTIQKACDTAGPGDTVDVHGGTYNERVTVNVSGSATGGFVTVQNFPGETPIVDGTGLTVPSTDTGLFLLVNR